MVCMSESLLEIGATRHATPSVLATIVSEDALAARRATAAIERRGIVVVAAGSHLDGSVVVRGLHRSDVAVLICDLSQAAEMTALRTLSRACRTTPIVVVGLGARRAGVREALNNGADGFLFDADVETSLASIIRTVAVGYVSVPRVLRRCIVPPAFSHRERQVLALVAEGCQNREIADRLFLAESTVKSHLASSFEKLGVRSRKEAATLLLDPSEGLRALIPEYAPQPLAAT